MTIKIIHLADLHIGVEVGPIDKDTGLNGRVMDYLDTLEAVGDFANDNSADLILIAGDTFHHPHPSPTLVKELSERIIALSEICPVVIVIGNHDIPPNPNKASVIDLFHTLRVPNVIVGWDYEIHTIQTKSGAIQVCTFPFPFKTQFISNKEAKSGNGEDGHKLFQARVSAKIKELAKKVNPDIPSVLVAHLGVSGCKHVAGVLPNSGAEVRIQDLTDGVWDYVALGHIHKFQVLNDNPPVIYPGSLERVTFGEEFEPKGFIWVEIGDYSAETSWEFIEVDARPYITLNFDMVGKAKPTQRILNKIEKLDLTGAIVRLIIEIEDHREKMLHMGTVLDAIAQSGMYYLYNVAINRVSAQRSRLDVDVPISTLSKTKLLSLYFQDKGVKRDKIKPLLVIAKEIMENVENE